MREYVVARGKFLVIIGCAMIALIVVVYAVIATTRPDGVDNYLTVMIPIMTPMIALVALGAQMEDVRKDIHAVNSKVESVSGKVETIEHQTNGALTKQLDDVKTHVTQVVTDRESVKNDGPN